MPRRRKRMFHKELKELQGPVADMDDLLWLPPPQNPSPILPRTPSPSPDEFQPLPREPTPLLCERTLFVREPTPPPHEDYDMCDDEFVML